MWGGIKIKYKDIISILSIFFVLILSVSIVNAADNVTDDIGSVEETDEIVSMSDNDVNNSDGSNENDYVLAVENQDANNPEYEILSDNNVEDNKLTASIEGHETLGTAYVDLTEEGSRLYFKVNQADIMFKTPWKSKNVNFEIYEVFEDGYTGLSYSGNTNTDNNGLCLIKYDPSFEFYLRMWADSNDKKTYHIYGSTYGELYIPPDTNQKSTQKSKTTKSGKIITKIKVKTIKVKPKSKIYIKAKVYDKSSGKKLRSGKVTFKIMGKTYKVKVKKGIAKIKIKIPSKIKTYRGKAKFLGNKNARKSSTKFKIIVKKPVAKKKTSIKKKKTKSKTHTYKSGSLKCTITHAQYKKLKNSKSDIHFKAKNTGKKYVYYGAKKYKIYVTAYTLRSNVLASWYCKNPNGGLIKIVKLFSK